MPRRVLLAGSGTIISLALIGPHDSAPAAGWLPA